LIEKLTFIILNINEFQNKQIKISETMDCFAWENMIKKYDHVLERLSQWNARHGGV